MKRGEIEVVTFRDSRIACASGSGGAKEVEAKWADGRAECRVEDLAAARYRSVEESGGEDSQKKMRKKRTNAKTEFRGILSDPKRTGEERQE